MYFTDIALFSTIEEHRWLDWTHRNTRLWNLSLLIIMFIQRYGNLDYETENFIEKSLHFFFSS